MWEDVMRKVNVARKQPISAPSKLRNLKDYIIMGEKEHQILLLDCKLSLIYCTSANRV